MPREGAASLGGRADGPRGFADGTVEGTEASGRFHARGEWRAAPGTS